METTQLITWLGKKLNLSGVADQEGLYTGVEELRGKAFAKYIIDFRQKEITPEFIQGINDNLLAHEYYHADGAQQWNIYYLYVTEIFDHDKKAALEENKYYARKYYLNGGEVLNLFEKDFSAKGVDTGLYQIWKKELEENNLGFIADETISYAEGVSKLLNPTSRKRRQRKVVKGTGNFKVDKINRILEWDRSRIKINHLPEFRKINLITGSNASGKTSLLEHIELALCGETFRNYGENSEVQLKVEINGSKEEIYDGNSSKYLERDAFWYGGTGNRKSKNLTSNFAKYNFFDSDASYRISIENESSDNTNKQLDDIFSKIALGRDINALNSRIGEFLKKFNSENRKISKIYDKDLEALNENKQALNELKKVNVDPEKLIEEIFERLDEYGWLHPIEEYNNALDELPDDLFYVIENLEDLISIFEDQEVPAMNGLEEKKERFLKCEGEIEKIGRLQTENNQKIDKLRETQLEKQRIESSFRNIKDYLKEDDFFKVEKLAKEKEALSSKIQSMQSWQSDFILGVDTVVDEYENIEFGNVKEMLEEKIEKHRRIIRKQDLDIENIEELLKVTKGLTSQIKRLGLEYLEGNKDINHCPMCSAEYERIELIKRIKLGVESLGSVEKLSRLKEKRKQEKLNLVSLEKNYKNLQELKELFVHVLEKEPTDLKIGKIFTLLEKAFSRIPKLEEEHLKVQKRLKNLTKIGIDVGFYNKLKDQVMTAFGITLSLRNSQRIIEQVENAKVEAKKLEKEINKCTGKTAMYETKVMEVVNKVFLSSISDFTSKKNEVVSAFEDATEISEALSEYLTEESYSTVKTCFKKMKVVSKKVSKYEEDKKAFESDKLLRKNYTENINKYKKNVDEGLDKKEKVETAISFLETLISKHSIQRAMDDFFKSNISSINQIYISIHSPKEFSEIDYNVSKKEIELTKHSGEKVTVSQVSSGQRAAVALSIFLTLNKNLVNGPSLLIFDDPVIFADDLNVLSFFDYLRSVSIVSDRQIFFATANEKVAALFRRKFSMFEEEFGEINFQSSDLGGLKSA